MSVDASALAASAVAPTSAKPIRWGRAFTEFIIRLFRDKPFGAAAGIVFVVFLGCGIFADFIAPHGFNEIAPIDRLKPPSPEYPFGTDNLGRDMFSRCLYGAQLSVVIALSTAVLSTLLSVMIGMISGYLGGRADMLTQRVVDAFMIFPELIILIVVASMVGPGMLQIIGTLSVLLGVGGSRIIRSAVVSVRENMYVHASQSIGAGTRHILMRHILPNILPPVIVLFTTRIGTAILAESSLAFLGFGVPPPAPTWGGMLTGSGRTYMFQGPWLALAPGLCLTVVVFATNIFGDALRDLLDPRMRGSS